MDPGEENTPAQRPTALIDSADTRVVEFCMGPSSKGDRHYHTSVKEYCACLEGRLLIEHDEKSQTLLNPGQRMEIAPGVIHRASNPEEALCRFIVIQGGGNYDFVTV